MRILNFLEGALLKNEKKEAFGTIGILISFLFFLTANARVVGNNNGRDKISSVKQINEKLTKNLQSLAEAEEEVGYLNEKRKKNEHDLFFKNLNSTEREWILRLAILHESGIQTKKLGVLKSKKQPKPVDETHLVPSELMELMLNGDVSKKFQKDLINWLKTSLGYTDLDFYFFNIDNSEFCRHDQCEADPGNCCLEIKHIGGTCCPFG